MTVLPPSIASRGTGDGGHREAPGWLGGGGGETEVGGLLTQGYGGGGLGFGEAVDGLGASVGAAGGVTLDGKRFLPLELNVTVFSRNYPLLVASGTNRSRPLFPVPACNACLSCVCRGVIVRYRMPMPTGVVHNPIKYL